MPEIHLPDGSTLHMAEGTSPEAMTAAVRQYGDQQAASAQQNTLDRQSAADTPHSAFARFFAPILPSEHLSDYTTGFAHSITHPLESADLLGSAIKADPVGATPVVGNAKRGYEDVKSGNYAGAAGEGVSGLLQLLGLGGRHLIPEGAGSAIARGTGSVTAAAGRGLESLGKSKPIQRVGGLGAAAELLRGNPIAAAGMASAPLALDYGGKGLQKLGATIRGLGVAAPEAEAGAAAAREVPARYKAGYEARRDAFGQENADQWLDHSLSHAPQFEAASAAAKAQAASKGIPKPDLMSAAQGLDGPKPAFDWPEAGGRYEADAAGSHKLIPSADGVPDFLQSELHSGYNNGHVLPEGMAPTERLAQASSGLETPHTGGSTFDVDYGGFLPDVPKFDYEGGVPPSPVSVGEMPAPNPLSRLEAAKQSLGAEPSQIGSSPTPSGMPNYTDWAQGMDDVINSASEEDMPNAASSGLARSRPTNAIKDWMSKLQQTNGRGWPFSEIQP